MAPSAAPALGVALSALGVAVVRLKPKLLGRTYRAKVACVDLAFKRLLAGDTGLTLVSVSDPLVKRHLSLSSVVRKSFQVVKFGSCFLPRLSFDSRRRFHPFELGVLSRTFR
jgi:hypothetical protein